jgi:hypothetical protein
MCIACMIALSVMAVWLAVTVIVLAVLWHSLRRAPQ